MDLARARAWVRERLFELVTLLLALVAIVFACIQYRDARRQLDRLRAITSSIQTQYVGEFPTNMDRIIEVINNVGDQGELDVMTDFAGYGIYSRNDKYQEYLNALVRAHQQRSVRIKMMVYDKPLVQDAFQVQIKTKDFEEEKKVGFRDFFKKRPPDPADYPDFISRIVDLQNDSANDFCRNGVEVRRVPLKEKYVYFSWQSSNPEAVFAFRNEEERNREISFHTLDAKLIEIFKTIFDQTWAKVDPKTHPELAAGEDPACQYLNASANAAK
jgi:hypothetical protein